MEEEAALTDYPDLPLSPVSALLAVSSSYVETKHFKPLSFDSVVTEI